MVNSGPSTALHRHGGTGLPQCSQRHSCGTHITMLGTSDSSCRTRLPATKGVAAAMSRSPHAATLSAMGTGGCTAGN